MKKTILQMISTVVVLTIIFYANENFIYQNSMAVDGQISVEAVDMPIIMYHSILKDSARQGKYVISPKQLKDDIEYIKSQGYTAVTVNEVIAYVNDEGELPEKPIMITFDDGYYNNFLYAYPILQETNTKAVISIVGSLTEKFTESGEENAYWSHLKIDHLNEMQSSGLVEIQNHSYDFHTMDKRRGCLRVKGESSDTYKQILETDTVKAQKLLIENGIQEPTCYTYPFGSLNNESEAIIREMGFKATLGCEEGINKITKNEECLYKMKRYNRPTGKSSKDFFAKIL